MPPKRPTNVRADARRNKGRIVEVARETFGVHGTSVAMEEIARRAGVGIGTLYRHFATKEALIAEIVREQIEQAANEAGKYRERSDAGAAFFAFIEQLWDSGPRKKALVDALVGTSIDVRELAASASQKLRRELAALLERAQATGDVRGDVDVKDVIALLGASLNAAQRGGTRDRLFAIVCDGLAARAPKRRVTA